MSASDTPLITVRRWVDEDGRKTRNWYWEIRAGDQVIAAGLLDNTQKNRKKLAKRHTEADAWRMAARSLAAAAYQRGLEDGAAS